MSFTLVLFDGLSLAAADGGAVPAAALQRRRLALLALLALADERGVSRETVQAYLWPESPPDRARHALDQLLYATRRDLGRDAVLSGASDLRLNPQVVDTDVRRFERALAAERWAEAAALRRGPLLNGVHVLESAAAERWLDEERERLDRLYHTALETLATETTARGDHAAAVGWWRRRAAAEPLSTPVALALMRALAAAGDRPGAVQHARVFTRLLESELGVAAEPAVAGLAAELAAPPPAVEARPAVEGAGAGAAPAAASAASSSDVGRGREERSGTVRPGLRMPARRGTLLGAAVVALALGAIAAGRRDRPTPPAGSPVTVAVLPFHATGGPDAAALAEGMTVLLSANLNDVGDLRGVDPRALLSFVARSGADEPGTTAPAFGARVAANFGAGRFVLGNVVEAGGRLRITATLYDRAAGGRPMPPVIVEGTRGEFFTLVDRLTARLVAELQGGPNARLVRSATSTTESFPALRAYLQGERAMRVGRYGDAAAAFQQAVAADTTFALAYYRLALAATWSDRPVPPETPAALAARFADRLSDRDRTLLEAFRAEWAGDGETAERHYRVILDRHPDDVESWFRLGEVHFHNGPLYGRPTLAAVDAFERTLALDPASAEAMIHLARLAALRGDERAFDSLAARHRALIGGATGQAWELHAVAAMRDGPAAAARLASELRDATIARRFSVVRNAAVYGGDLATTARLTRAIFEHETSPEGRALGPILEAYLAVARGRLGAARELLARARAFDPLLAAEHGGLLAAAPFLAGERALVEPAADSAAWGERVDGADAHPAAHGAPALGVHHAVHEHIRLYVLGLAAARAGDTAAAEAYARAVAARPAATRVPSLAHDLARSIRAHAAYRAGHHALALQLLEAAPVRAPVEYANYSPLYPRPQDRFLRAELLLAMGRAREAVGWYESFGGDSFYDLAYLAPAQRRLAELHERFGDRARAAVHLERVRTLWADADAGPWPTTVGRGR